MKQTKTVEGSFGEMKKRAGKLGATNIGTADRNRRAPQQANHTAAAPAAESHSVSRGTSNETSTFS